jgi:hypothetical protein
LASIEFKDELCFLDMYSITPNEYFFLKAALLYHKDTAVLKRYLEIGKRLGIDFREMLVSLQDKGLILKSYKIPLPGERFTIEEIQFNQNLMKKLSRATNDMAMELYDMYPTFAEIQGVMMPIRTVSKKFDSIEEWCRFYGKTINYNEEKHREILDLIQWAKDNCPQILNCSLCSFTIDHRWDALKEARDGSGGINYNTVRML